MVITLSRFSGQETSECNGSAGSPQYGFITMQGLEGRICHLLLFSTDRQTPMNNVRELIQGDRLLTNNTEGQCLASTNRSTKHVYPMP